MIHTHPEQVSGGERQNVSIVNMYRHCIIYRLCMHAYVCICIYCFYRACLHVAIDYIFCGQHILCLLHLSFECLPFLFIFLFLNISNWAVFVLKVHYLCPWYICFPPWRLGWNCVVFFLSFFFFLWVSVYVCLPVQCVCLSALLCPFFSFVILFLPFQFHSL